MVALAGYSDAGYVRQLWDVYLRQARLFWHILVAIVLHVSSLLRFKV